MCVVISNYYLPHICICPGWGRGNGKAKQCNSDKQAHMEGVTTTSIILISLGDLAKVLKALPTGGASYSQKG